jgi:hypothetical protein
VSATVSLVQAQKVYRLIAERQKAKAEKDLPVVPERVGPRKYELLKQGKLLEAGFNDVTAAVGSFLTYSALKHLLDPEKIAADFEASALHANWPKTAEIEWPEDWIEKWRRLGKSELDKAIARARVLIEKKLNREKAEPEIDPATWTQHLTPLSIWKIDPPVEIVEGIIVRDAITVLAGLFESYKSMFALELMSAIRQNRLAFDHFKVFSQPEVLQLCLDMSPAGFYKYASFFGLHQDEGFRGIDPHSPVGTWTT